MQPQTGGHHETDRMPKYVGTIQLNRPRSVCLRTRRTLTSAPPSLPHSSSTGNTSPLTLLSIPPTGAAANLTIKEWTTYTEGGQQLTVADVTGDVTASKLAPNNLQDCDFKYVLALCGPKKFDQRAKHVFEGFGMNVPERWWPLRLL